MTMVDAGCVPSKLPTIFLYRTQQLVRGDRTEASFLTAAIQEFME